ncbi:hypothetical protein HZH66_010426 [Vespula vulgaris]|uniref:Uncharacterized protein n=1 Tax=Vespula vulgaris TaxID=7454 RepID=A0A834JJD0_VESVU|nr:hypothetical protein HZH66_010426 [Vespula vulgaris]
MNGFPVDGCHGRYQREDYRNRFAPACSVKKKNPSGTPVSVEIRSKFMDVSSLIRKGPATGLVRGSRIHGESWRRHAIVMAVEDVAWMRGRHCGCGDSSIEVSTSRR